MWTGCTLFYTYCGRTPPPPPEPQLLLMMQHVHDLGASTATSAAGSGGHGEVRRHEWRTARVQFSAPFTALHTR